MRGHQATESPECSTEEGFAITSYKNRIEYKTGFFTCVKVTSTKNLLIRGESGDWADGPVICGSHMTGASATDRATWCGEGAATCFVGAGTAYTTLLGIRLEGGATQAADGQYGGGALNATLRNCLVANCAAYQRGGGTSGCNTYDCAVTNCYCARGSNTYGGGHYDGTHSNDFIFACYCSGQGGGVRSTTCYDCIITNSTAGSYGGSACADKLYRCKLYGGTATNGGGASYQGTLWDCEISSCGNSALYNANAYGCVVSNCTGGSGSGFYFKDGNIASNCTFVANASPSIGVVSANFMNRLIDCKILENRGHGIELAYKNGSTFLVVSNCTVEGVNVSSCAVSVQQSTSKADVVQTLKAYNSVFKGPIAGSGDFYNCLITGANSSTLPTVFCNASRATNKDGLVIPLKLYNCTVINNVSTYSTAGNVAGGYVNAYNTIIRDNTAPVGKVDELATAVNCCLSDTATVAAETDCIREDPALYLGTGDYFYPTASSPCRTAGSLTAYELTPTDLAGQPRTSNGGTTVAIGACEFDPNFVGASIVCLPETTKAPATGKFTVTYSGLGEDLTFSWDFNGDGTIDLVTNVATVAYYYPEAGDYRANVSVSDGQKTVTAEQAMSILDGYFVSAKNIHEVPGRTGGWGIYTFEDGQEYLAYTNLQQAVDAASVGDTVWIDSDYVWEEGSETYDSRVTRLRVDKKLVIRGQTGDWRTGPTIRGAYNTPGTTTDGQKCGANAVTCVGGSSSANVTLVGIRLVGGATTASGTGGDTKGGGAKSVTLKNCLVADCASYLYGGGVYECDTESSVISNCYVGGHNSSSGGGAYKGTHTNAVFVGCTTPKTAAGIREGTLYDCVMTNCVAAGTGGASYQTTCYRTMFLNCKANGGSYGGAGYDSTFYGCLIRNCNFAVVRGKMYDTVIDSCTALYTASASGFRPAANSVASNCTFMACTQNTVCPDGPGLLIDCTFTNTFIAVNPREKEINIENCRFFCDYAVGIENRRDWYKGQGYAHVRNSEIHGHVATCGEFYNCLIEGGTNTSNASLPVVYCSEAMVTNNAAEEVRPLRLYNCTVTRNHSKSSSGIAVGGGYVTAVNSIIWGNSGNTGAVDTFLAASNSCIEASAEVGDAYQCVSYNPRFMGTPGDEYVPRAAKLYGKGQVFDWMSDPEDVRSQDLAGKPRLHEGTVDMGAFAMYPLPGLMLLVR